MIQNNAAEELLERLVRAARLRRETLEKEMADGEFEKFILAVQRLGTLTVTCRAEDINLGTMGMAMDYYSRAIALMAEEARVLAEAAPGGTA